MPEFTPTQVDTSNMHRQYRGYSAEASDLQWPPGRWPLKLTLSGSANTVAVEYLRTRNITDGEGELLGVVYELGSRDRDTDGVEIDRVTVYND